MGVILSYNPMSKIIAIDLKRVEISVVLLIVLLSGAYLGGLFRF